MTTTARLEPSATSVRPGEETRVGLELRSAGGAGEIVEAFRFEVVGAPAGWAVVEPESVSVYPGRTAQAVLVLRPPAEPAPPAGTVPYAVRVVSVDRPDHTLVPEGVLEVLPVERLDAELLPRMSQGRGGARHRIAIDNRGNRPVAATLTGSDRGELLTFSLPPVPTVTEPGRAAFVRAGVKPKRRIWRGQAVPHAFQVQVTPEGGAPITLDGTFLQQPVLGKGLLKAVVAVVAVAAALAGVWFGLLRPAVRSAAKEAVKDPVQAAQSQAAEAAQKAAGAQNAAAAAQKAAGMTPSPGAAGPATPGTGPEPGAGAALFSHRLTVAPKQDKQATDTFPVPAGKTLRLTDLVLENPQGDTGTITIAVDDKPLLSPALENFREQDFHWSSALIVTGGQHITLTVTCRQIGQPPTAPAPTSCNAAGLLSGALE
ncbi:hypothetical protein [Kitasatospora cinereorecta]|uniref:Hydrolytic protein n=1 Tax=Kitasatospora cinereorecta TaxID=285560 RepID=A0ABW0VK65_9ACTN